MVKKDNGYREPSNSIFNSAAVPFEVGEYKFACVFRIDDRDRTQELHAGFSEDGIHQDINEERIKFKCDIPEIAQWTYGYDPRVSKLVDDEVKDRYAETQCNCYSENMISKNSNNLNGVLFPPNINNKYVMMNGPSDNGHTHFGDLFMSQSPDIFSVLKEITNSLVIQTLSYSHVITSLMQIQEESAFIYGCTDASTGLAFTTVDAFMEFLE